jgi:peptide deformylase
MYVHVRPPFGRASAAALGARRAREGCRTASRPPILSVMEGSTTQQQAAASRDTSGSESAQRREMALRHVRQYPDPVLRQVALDVAEFDGELRALADRMFSIMRDAWGVGLAAPQLGLRLRLFTWQLEFDDEPQAIANPEITWSSEETDVDDEGCLSLGELRVPVERPVAIKVTGKDLDGNDVTYDLEGFPARVFQHEIDHLNGKLLMDRTDADSRKQAFAYLRPKP